MSQNFDLIEIIGGGDSSGECNCAESDFTSFFISKTNGLFEGSLGSTETSWSPYAFTLGALGSNTKSVLVVQGNGNDKAEIVTKSSSHTTTVYPDKINSPRFETPTGNIVITDNSCQFGNVTLNGNVVPNVNNTYNLGSTSNRIKEGWFVDVGVSGTLVITNLSPTTLSVGGTSTFTGLATFNGNIAVPGTSTLGTVTGTGATFGTGNFTTSITSPSGVFTNSTVSAAPSGNTDVVRRQDVYVSTNPALALGLHKIQVTNGFITNVQTASATDLPTHASRHHTTTKTTAAPGSGFGGDGLHSYQIGAVERAEPVVKKPLRITSNDNYTWSTSQPYFVVIESNEEPAVTGPEGQIIFRKAQA